VLEERWCGLAKNNYGFGKDTERRGEF
jgi:hypothetical protein